MLFKWLLKRKAFLLLQKGFLLISLENYLTCYSNKYLLKVKTISTDASTNYVPAQH